MTQHLEELLETLVRPALREHGGDVELVRYENGVLRLKMLGRCAPAPARPSPTRPSSRAS